MSSSVKEGIIAEIHRPIRINYRRRHYNLKGLNDLWEVDLMDMKHLKKYNHNYQYVLIIIDAFSKQLYGVLLKNKTGLEVSRGMKSILDRGISPINLQSDRGSEFYNKHFQTLMRTYGISHYSTYSNIKCAHAERVIRTLKERIYRNLHFKGTYNYSKTLQNIIHDYNHHKHRTINMIPANVTKNNESLLLKHIYKNLKPFDSIRKHKGEKFMVGDYVRISRERGIFDKSHLVNWSTELFKISEIKSTLPITYLLEDLEGAPISGCFYPEELQRTKFKNEFLVEKIIKKKRGMLLIKWLGFQKPTWVNQSDVLL